MDHDEQLDQAALALAKAMLGQQYHPSRLQGLDEYRQVALSLQQAGMLEDSPRIDSQVPARAAESRTPMAPSVRRTFTLDEAVVQRAVNAWAGMPGTGTWSEFVQDALAAHTTRVEAEHNGGRPFEKATVRTGPVPRS